MQVCWLICIRFISRAAAKISPLLCTHLHTPDARCAAPTDCQLAFFGLYVLFIYLFFLAFIPTATVVSATAEGLVNHTTLIKAPRVWGVYLHASDDWVKVYVCLSQTKSSLPESVHFLLFSDLFFFFTRHNRLRFQLLLHHKPVADLFFPLMSQHYSFYMCDGWHCVISIAYVSHPE